MFCFIAYTNGNSKKCESFEIIRDRKNLLNGLPCTPSCQSNGRRNIDQSNSESKLFGKPGKIMIRIEIWKDDCLRFHGRCLRFVSLIFLICFTLNCPFLVVKILQSKRSETTSKWTVMEMEVKKLRWQLFIKFWGWMW